ncbi:MULTISPECIES: SCO family protein [unclassified Sphingomonas]|uniref:SCO family protein n=1 Tax=unclassified Sphingomonas TaxID=196159 RepID=UPI0006FBD252|nr:MULTISPECIES: SCO family protein [unclassified Sphingomonas]KQX19094.1 hypothetical protein ASD17_11025 [Sphingomonas sp. Root1294]KQY65295.1 hypothetical protein ASD39_14220 [Sphingomonas sp. Root50]KRB95410.1 hypothetical protein ASE22_05835 [Sphingomonas sp. Root720]
MTLDHEGSFSLTDHDGLDVTQSDFRGRFMLVAFGFTHCRVVCPRVLGRISDALDLLEPLAKQIQPIYITVDPERDTPDAMRRFLTQRYPRFRGLTGTAAQIDRAKASFKVFAQHRDDPDDPAGYAVAHTAFAYLMDRTGGYRTHFADAGDAAQLAGSLHRFLD